jgi:sterol desaturase/sphingolipid hydroxylase (fatty acid hydroxylase superfamily)
MSVVVSTLLRDLGQLFYLVPISTNYTSVEDVPDYITTAIPYFILLMTLEFFYGKWQGRDLYTVKDTVMSISLGMTQQIVQIWAKEVSLVFYIITYNYSSNIRNRLFPFLGYLSQTNQNLIVQLFVFVTSFLAVDCGYYWFHRYAHEFHALWVSHAVHHSGERYNLATALRQGAVQFLTSWVFYLPFAALGVSPAQFVRHNRLNTLYQFWIHTEVIGRLPWFLEMIFNSPSHHRLHHRPPGNCNYAGVLIVWDRIFGTFISECDFLIKKDVTPVDTATTSGNNKSVIIEDYPRGVIYGLAQPLNSFDPVVANVQHATRMAMTAPSTTWFGRISHLFMFTFKKRVHHPLVMNFSCSEIFSDLIFDLAFAKQSMPQDASAVQYICFFWNRLWRLPPKVDETKPLDPKQWSSRDFQFLTGRLLRESPILSAGQRTLVIIHFLLTLIVVFWLLLFENSPVFFGQFGVALKLIISLACIQSLRSIRWYY